MGGARTFVCGDPLCASRRQQAGQGDGPRRSQKKSLFRYKNFDGTDRCNECYDESRKERAIMLAILRCPLQIVREQAGCLSWRVCSKGGR